MDDKFPGGKEVVFGLKEDGVGIAPSQDNVSKDALKAVDEYKQKILDGDITVPQTDKEFKEFEKRLKNKLISVKQ